MKKIHDGALSGEAYRWHFPLSFRRSVTISAIPFGSLFFLCIAYAPSLADPNPQAGKAYAKTNCSQCHSIDKSTPSSLAIAPPFRTLHKRYPIEDLEEALGEGIVTGHPSMPEFRLDPGQVADFISFLRSLE